MCFTLLNLKGKAKGVGGEEIAKGLGRSLGGSKIESFDFGPHLRLKGKGRLNGKRP